MKLGVFIGSFDPIHIGHINVMDYLINNNYLDKIIIVPTFDYWDNKYLTNVNVRCEMISLIKRDYLIIDNANNRYRYNYEIIDALNNKYINDELFIIASSCDLDKWKNVDDILIKNKVILFNNDTDKYEQNDRFIIIKDFPFVDISSTSLRNKLDKAYLNDEVYKYIVDNKLYGNNKKMHVIIAGAARAGKTTLSIMLNKYGYTHYKMDSIKRGICEYYNLVYDDWEKVSPIMCKIINRIIVDNKTDTNYKLERYLFDTPFLYPKDIESIDTSETKVIFLGYAHIDVDEEMNLIRKNDKEHFWTSRKNDDELRKEIIDNIEFSKYLESECKRLGITYYDTSFDRENVLNKIIEDITGN